MDQFIDARLTRAASDQSSTLYIHIVQVKIPELKEITEMSTVKRKQQIQTQI